MQIDWRDVQETSHEVLNFELLTLGGVTVTPTSLLTFLVIFLISLLVSKLAQRTVASSAKRLSSRPDAKYAGVQRLVHYLIMIIGLGVGLQAVGINISMLFTAGAIFAVGIGFAMQTIMQNFVSGIILLMERAINPGDVLEVDDMLVRVTKVGIRTTLARTRDDEDLIIPNAVLAQSIVKNHTLEDSFYRVRAEVGVAYESDMHQVRSVLEQAARESVADPTKEAVVLMLGFGASTVDWEVSVWTDSPWDEARLRSQLFEKIWFALKEHQITIAFPQMDVHFDEGFERAIFSARSAQS